LDRDVKCPEKDRARRYETANGLARDIQRHFNNEAVLARPPSAAYRFQKLVRRNKAMAAAAAVARPLLGHHGRHGRLSERQRHGSWGSRRSRPQLLSRKSFPARIFFLGKAEGKNFLRDGGTWRRIKRSEIVAAGSGILATNQKMERTLV
jgi:hypothetical protein